jgi:hypothetical protein
MDGPSMSIELLTPPGNYAVCKMEERRFPGIVVQGDGFFSLLSLLKRIHSSMEEKCPLALDDEIVELKYQIKLYENVLINYEKICNESGFGLPYFKT